jgi:DNA mismatch repair protein MutS
VIRAAQRHLQELEARDAAAHPQQDLFAATVQPLPPEPADTAEAVEHPALLRLRAADPDAMAPREALDLVYELRRLLDN